MKKYLFLLAAAAMMIGCTQEPIDTPVNAVTPDEPEEIQTHAEPSTPAEPKVVSFSAELPEFEGLTKASVDASAFTWEAGDEIAIPVKDGEGVRYVNFRNSAGALNTFTYSVTDEEFVDGTAYYPATSAPGGTYSTTFASIAEAQSSFKMTAPVTLGSSSLTFTHLSSIVHLTFTNVPSLANKLVVNDGTSNVATINFSQTGDVAFNVPITPAGSSKTYTFKLQENNNVLKQASKTADLAAGTYYNAKAAVPVGKIIRVQDATDWGTKALYIWNNANGAENAFFSTGGSYPYIFNTISGSEHYIVLPSECAWATATTKVGVKFQTEDNSSSTQTDGIYPTRDITFNVPAGLGMKTEYRIYPKSSTRSSLNMYITKPFHIYVKNTAGWGTYEVHGFGHKDATSENSGWTDSWSGNQAWSGSYSIGGNTDLARFDVNPALCGSDSGAGIGIGYFGNSDNWNLNTLFVGDCYINFTGSTSTLTEYFDNRISAEWPGTAFTGITSSLNAEKYVSFYSSYYGQEIWVVFSESGSSQSSTWTITVNQDYDYGY